MKNQHKKEWIIGKIAVILLVALSSLSAQTSKSQKQDQDIKRKTENQGKDSINLNKTINLNKDYFIIDRYERMPTFPGGEEKLTKIIKESIRYPIEDKENGIEGKVIVQFIVTKTGKIEKAEVVRSVSRLIDEEALRVVKSLPNFIPGEENGMKVDIKYTLPVSFRINPTEKNTNVYTVVEKMPQFPGGDDSLVTFIHKNLRLDPAMETSCGIPGKVVVRFIVTETGSVTHVEVIRPLDPACDREAIRVIKLLPDFIPAEHNGKKVAVYYTLPISFRLL